MPTSLLAAAVVAAATPDEADAGTETPGLATSVEEGFGREAPGTFGGLLASEAAAAAAAAASAAVFAAALTSGTTAVAFFPSAATVAEATDGEGEGVAVAEAGDAAIPAAATVVLAPVASAGGFTPPSLLVTEVFATPGVGVALEEEVAVTFGSVPTGTASGVLVLTPPEGRGPEASALADGAPGTAVKDPDGTSLIAGGELPVLAATSAVLEVDPAVGATAGKGALPPPAPCLAPSPWPSEVLPLPLLKAPPASAPDPLDAGLTAVVGVTDFSDTAPVVLPAVFLSSMSAVST